MVVVAVLAAATIKVTGPALAAITTPFTTRFDVNVNGSILLRGNSNLTCPQADPDCTPARSGQGGVVNNNNFAMVYTNADGDPTTFDDSTATLDMPPGSTVLFAGLYWGADSSSAPTPGNRNKVLLRTPAGAAWNPITASSLFPIPSSGVYQGFADVTGQVAGVGNGVYGVANIQASTGTGQHAGWALAVAYRNPAEDMRSLRIYDGFGSIASGTLTIPVSGFETPHAGTVHAKIGAVAYEGDLGSSGDSLLVDGQALHDTANQANNFFNSTVSEGGSPVGGHDPPYPNLLGFDVDQVDATGMFAHGATSSTLTLTTTGDTYYPGVITFTIDLYAPKITTTMTGTDVDGGDLLPGDVIEYRIAVRNDGSDTADDVVLADAVPLHTTYLPGSLTVQGAPVSDATGDDSGWYASGSAGWNLGSIPYLGTTYVTFRVRVDVATPAGYAITNLVNVSYTGRTTSVSVAGLGGAVATPVLQPHADRAAALAVAPAAVQRAAAPQPVTYTATVTNLSGDLEPAASAELTLPTGVSPGTLPAGCTAAGQVVTCALGPLVAGTSASVPIPAVAGAAAVAAAVATLRATGSGADGNAGNDTATATLAVNSSPQAVADAASTTNGTPVTVPVRDNDTDPDDPVAGLTVSIATPPAHGTAVVEADQTVTYTPAAIWWGADTFVYRVDDPHGGSDTAVATVTTADAPPSANDDMINTPSNTPVTLAVLANDTDPNGDPLGVVAVTQPPVTTGTVTVTGNLVTFTPTITFAGRAAFTYTVQDSGGAGAVGDVYVDVDNAAPTAADDVLTVSYASAGSVLAPVLGNDTDPNLDTLTVTSAGTPDHGTATVVAGGVQYSAPAGFSGDATFAYTISDGHGGTSTAQVTITVGNAGPTAAPFVRSIAYGTPLTLDVAGAATDPNGDAVRLSGSTDPANGVVLRDPAGTLTYTPDPGFSGVDGFTYTIDDGHGGTDTATVTVTVANGVAVARPDSITAAGGTPVTITVLANDDDDPNGQPLTITTDLPGHGSASVGADRRITYTPAAGFLGVDTFHYQLDDLAGGVTSATVTVTVVNTPPVCRADAVATDTDTAVIIAVLDNDDDPNGDQVTLDGAGGAGFGTVADNGDGTLTYTPDTGFYGTDSFGYAIRDPSGSTDSAIVTVTVRNAAPIALDDHYVVRPGVPATLALLANDHDPNTGQVLSVASVGPVARGTLTLAAGTVTYRAGIGSVGADIFDYVLTDDLGRTDTGTVTITIDGPPVAVADTVLVPADTEIDIPVTANDTDPESEPLTVTAVGAPAHGTARVNANGTVGYTPAAGFVGTDTFSYAIRDPVGNVASGQVTVRVANAAPVARPDVAALLADRFVLVDVLANDGDVNPGQTLAILAVGAAGHGTATVSGGRIRYAPAAGWTGSDVFTYTITDGAGGVATTTVTITVSPGTPVALPDAGDTPYQHPITIGVLANDVDPAGTLAVTAVTQPNRGAATFTASAVTYTPPPDFTGTAEFAYTATDDAGHRTSAAVTIAVGVPPAVPDRTVIAKPGSSIGFDLPGTATDGRPVTVRAVGRPAHGTAVLNADGTVTYTPDPGFTGVDTFTYEVVDADGNVAQASIIVTVPAPTTTPTPSPTPTAPPATDRPPVAGDDRATVVAGDTVVLRPTLNDRDPDGDPITIVAVEDPAHGTAVADPGGTVTYAPGAAFTSGVDAFGYTITDGRGARATATVTVTVTAAAALPVTGQDGRALVRAGLLAIAAGGLLCWLGGIGPPELPRPRPGRQRPERP